MLSTTELTEPDENEPMPDFLYRQAIGMLSYLAHASQPNILLTVTQLSQFVNCFSQQHVITVKHIIHYLTGTHDLTICYNKAQYNCKDPSTCMPVGYCNTNWGNS
jgi:hypothetical protein